MEGMTDCMRSFSKWEKLMAIKIAYTVCLVLAAIAGETEFFINNSSSGHLMLYRFKKLYVANDLINNLQRIPGVPVFYLLQQILMQQLRFNEGSGIFILLHKELADML